MLVGKPTGMELVVDRIRFSFKKKCTLNPYANTVFCFLMAPRITLVRKK